MGAARPATLAVPMDVRAALRERSGGLCEVGRAGCLLRATEAHHRVPRGYGGRHGQARQVSDRLSNLLDVCRACHGWVHGHPVAARQAGWLLRVVPPFEPLLYRGEPCYLDDLGGVHAFEAVGA